MRCSHPLANGQWLQVNTTRVPALPAASAIDSTLPSTLFILTWFAGEGALVPMASGAPTFPSACAVPLDHDENATPRASATGRTKARAAGRATGRAVAVFAAIAMLAVVTIVVVVVVVVVMG